MTNRRFALLAFAALAFGVALLPAPDASAQTIWDRIRDRAEQRRDDDYNGRRRDGRINDRERRALRDVANRLDDRTRDFQRNIDRMLDRGRYDDTRREDNINNNVRRLREAAARFRDRAGDNNSSDEARRLLDAAAEVSRNLRRVRLDSRASSDWSQIRNDLRTVADIYNIRFRDADYDGGYYGNDDWNRDRNRRW